jgi:hypothetical protein
MTWRKVCEQVDYRSGGMCEANWQGVCPDGPHRGTEHHHRRLRAQGGPDTPANVMLLCKTAHDQAHNVDRAGANALGIIVREVPTVPYGW